MSGQTPILRVEHLKKYYPVKGGIFGRKIADLKAVDDVSFTVDPAETLGIVGESGCGKSTLGRQIVGLEKPSGGSIFYQNQELTAMKKPQLAPIRTEFSMVFQDSYSSLNPRKHIYEILAEPMLYHHLADRGNVEKKVRDLLDMVGLSANVMGRYPHEFSGGQRQRVGIAKALSLNPKLVVCDEPVSALDVSIQAQILNLLKDLQKERDLTLLFIGHGLGAVSYVSDRIAVMYLGQIVEIADTRELFANAVHPYAKALLAAAPSPNPRERDQKGAILTGEVASAVSPPSGCRFHPRCPYATERCRKEMPRLMPIREGSSHLAACPVFAKEEVRSDG